MDTPVYIIGIRDPKTDNQKNYRQELTFTRLGPETTGETTFPSSPGLPPSLVGKVIKTRPTFSDYNVVARVLMTEITNAFFSAGIGVDLTILEIKNSPPPPPSPDTPTYIIKVKDPKTPNQETYRQELTFVKSGFNKEGVTVFPPAAPPQLAGKVIRTPISYSNYNGIANELITIIRNEFFDKVGVELDFLILEIKNPPTPPTPPIPPQEVENTRKKEASQIQDDKSKIIDSDSQSIEKATPDSLKPKGSAKLSTLIRNIGKKIVTSLIPIAIDLVKQLVTKIVEDEIAKAKEKANKEQQEIQKNIDELEAKAKNGVGGLTVQIGALKTKKASIPIVVQTLENNLRAQLTNLGSFSFNDLVTNIPNILKEVFSNGCPNPNSPILKEIISKRNALVNLLNKLGTQLDRLTQAITGLNTYVDISQTAITAILTAKKVSSTAIKLVPSPPGTPGIITSLLSDLGDIINKLLFEKDGKPRLPKVSSAIAAAALAISTVNGYIKQIVSILNALDFKLKQCAPDLAGDNAFPGLTPISPDLISIALLQTEAEQTQNGVTYAGFVIEIEEVPYTPTVNRRRAVGKNQSGIKLVQTELSFTTQDEILINELKLIIDRDNLKAY